ncbi:MAG: CrcB family protein [Candidatus Marinimicrobia bacterium]|nr:CrcB family protein [Candidatus Neomarinimicrobiota bacterium]
MGGFIGVSLRYISSLGLDKLYTSPFLSSTFLINFSGCFILGILMNLGITNTETWPAKEFLVMGILGGFTTFSTFGMESYRLMESGQLMTALSYMIGSVIAGIFGIWLSQFLAKQI